MENEWPKIDENLSKIGHGRFAITMHLKTVTIIHAPLHEDNDRKLECGKIYKRSVEVPYFGT
jgi:hypothetical protein